MRENVDFTKSISISSAWSIESLPRGSQLWTKFKISNKMLLSRMLKYLDPKINLCNSLWTWLWSEDKWLQYITCTCLFQLTEGQKTLQLLTENRRTQQIFKNLSHFQLLADKVYIHKSLLNSRFLSINKSWKPNLCQVPF